MTLLLLYQANKTYAYLSGNQITSYLATVTAKGGANTTLTGNYATGYLGDETITGGDAKIYPSTQLLSISLSLPLVWGGLDQTQTPSWSAIDQTQTDGWSAISQSQTPNWSDTSQTQTPGWSDNNQSQSNTWTDHRTVINFR